MFEWGFPLDGTDLCYLVKSYLDHKGLKEKQFRNNYLSREFVYHFIKRYPEITGCFAGNIKWSRAAVTKEIKDKYFDHLQEELVWHTAQVNL